MNFRILKQMIYFIAVYMKLNIFMLCVVCCMLAINLVSFQVTKHQLQLVIEYISSRFSKRGSHNLAKKSLLSLIRYEKFDGRCENNHINLK